MSMKTLFLTCVGFLLLVSGAFSQTSTPAPATTPVSPAAVSPSVSPVVSPVAGNDLADKIHRRIDHRLKQKGIHFSVGGDDDVISGTGHHDDVPEAGIPLVAIIFMTVCRAPGL